MMVELRVFLINYTLDMTKLLNVTGNINRTIMIETVLFLGFLQQLHKQRMIDIDHRYDESLLLLALTNHNRQTTLGYIPILFLPATASITLLMVMMMEVEMEIDQIQIQMVVVVVVVMIFIATTHISKLKLILTTTRETKRENRTNQKGPLSAMNFKTVSAKRETRGKSIVTRRRRRRTQEKAKDQKKRWLA